MSTDPRTEYRTTVQAIAEEAVLLPEGERHDHIRENVYGGCRQPGTALQREVYLGMMADVYEAMAEASGEAAVPR